MDLLDIVYITYEKITGITKEEVTENEGIDFVKEGIVDSLAIVTIVQEISEITGKDIDIKKLNVTDFTLPEKLTEAIKRII